MTGGLQTSLSIRLPKHSEEEEFIITNNNTNSMQSPQAQALRNGGNNRSPSAPRFHSTVAEHKLRHFNSLILVFCLTSFSFSLASSVFMLTNSRGSDSPHWHHYNTFGFVVAANVIVAVYSVFEMGEFVWEFSRGATVPRSAASLVRFR